LEAVLNRSGLGERFADYSAEVQKSDSERRLPGNLVITLVVGYVIVPVWIVSVLGNVWYDRFSVDLCVAEVALSHASS
jgi:hypothetical protein